MTRVFLLIAFSSMLLQSCRKADRLTQFNVQYTSTATISSSATVSVPFVVITPDVETNSEATFAVNDTRKDKIQEIQLTSLNIQITNPQSQDFNFLKEVEIFINADGLSEILLASKYNLQNTNTQYLELDVSENDFQEYIKKEEFTLRVRTVTDEALLNDVDIEINSDFWVNAKLIGKA